MFAAALLLVSSLAAPALPAPQATIRAGTYDLEITYGGGVMEGVLVLESKADTFDVKLHVGEHDSPIRGSIRQGAKLTLIGGAEGMEVRYDLQFTGDTVSGTFVFNGTDGAVAGKRRKPKEG